MVQKLSRPDNNAQGGWGQQAPQQPTQNEQPPQEAPQQPAANGWGAAVGPDPNAQQREQIQEQIAPQPDRAAEAQAAFSGGVAQQANEIAQTDYGAVGSPEPTDRPVNGGWGSPAGQPAQQEAPAVVTPPPPQEPQQNGWGGQPQQNKQPPFDPGTQPATSEPDKPLSKMKKDELVEYAQKLEAQVGGVVSNAPDPLDGYTAVASLRAKVLAAVIASSPDMPPADLVEASREMMDFVLRG